MGIFFFFLLAARPELSRRAERSHRVFFVHDTLSSRAILLPLLLPQILIWGVGGS